MTETLKISGPSDLIRAVPYLLGFKPEESVVIVGLNDGRLIVAGRIDLVDATPAIVRETVLAIERGGANQYIVIYFTASQQIRDLVPLHMFGLLDADVMDYMITRDGRYWSALCTDETCCPPEGRPLDPEPSVFEAEVTVLGSAPEASREDLAMRIAPSMERVRNEAVLVEARFQADQPDEWRDGIFLGIANAMRDSTSLDDEVIAIFGAALADIPLRDRVWVAMDHDEWADPLPLLSELCRRLPDGWAVDPLFLYAWRCWRRGDGAMANVANERALSINPSHTASLLMQQTLGMGVNPDAIPPLTGALPS